MQASNKSMGLVEWLLLVTLSVLWGGSFFFVGIVVNVLPYFTIVVLRVGLAAVVLHVAVRAAGLRMPMDRSLWAAFFGMGLLNNAIPFSLIVWGQTYIASGLASILNATTPLFTVLVAHVLTDDEKITANRLVGVIVGFAGVMLIIGPEALRGLGTNILAQLGVLGGAISYAFAGILGRRFRSLGVSPVIAASGQVTASTLLLLPVAMATERPWRFLMPALEVWDVWVAIAGLALFSTVLAYILYFRILATAGATNLLLVTFLIPISAIALGTFILGERLQWKHLVGMGLIGIGLVAIDGRVLRFVHRRSTDEPPAAPSKATIPKPTRRCTR